MRSVRFSELRIIPYSVNSATFNMAADEYLLSLPGTILRLYGWEQPTLSFGRFRGGTEDINREVCRRENIQVVKRKSGGKTVLHQHEITYTLATDTSLFPLSVIESYRLISQPIAACFRKLGLTPEMKKTKGNQTESSICFKEVSAYELTIDQKKLVGSAQFRRKKRFLQHGSILMDMDWKLWRNIWNIPDDSPILENRITTLKKQLGYLPETDYIADLLIEQFSKLFQTEAIYMGFSDSDRSEIEKLMGKYDWKEFLITS